MSHQAKVRNSMQNEYLINSLSSWCVLIFLFTQALIFFKIKSHQKKKKYSINSSASERSQFKCRTSPWRGKKKRHSFHSIEHLHFLIATPGPEGFDPALAEISTIQYKTWPLSLWNDSSTVQFHPHCVKIARRKKKVVWYLPHGREGHTMQHWLSSGRLEKVPLTSC